MTIIIEESRKKKLKYVSKYLVVMEGHIVI